MYNTLNHSSLQRNMLSNIRHMTWQELLSRSISDAETLKRHFNADVAELETVTQHYPMRINPYYLSLITSQNDPIWRQAIPDILEIENTTDTADPLAEEAQSPTPGLTHRYPDRVLFNVSNICAMYCRFCLRKRKVGLPRVVSKQTIDAGIDYIREHPEIHEVILSGGDPFLIGDGRLENILHRIHGVPHIDIIRIHTRAPCTLPQRITPQLCAMLKRFQPIYINTHFNHPTEITPLAAQACRLMADAGIPLGCQTVLLKDINDTPHIIMTLMRRLAQIRVKPYYLHHPDPIKGTRHFRIPIKRGLSIIKMLRGNLPGYCIPQYMIDLPGGGGKIPLLPEYIKHTGQDKMIVENYEGKRYEYPMI